MRIGVQIYSLRDEIKDGRGVENVFDFLAQSGAQVVELACMPQMSDVELADISRRYCVDIISTHSDFKDIVNNTEKVIARHRTYGAEYIGIGSIPGKYRHTRHGVKKFCRLFNAAQFEAEKYGMNMIYHNHDFEFRSFRNKQIFDIMLEEFSPNVKICLDCYWAYAGGKDVPALIKKIGGRLAVIHCKDYPEGGDINGYKMCAVGDGILDYPAFLNAAEEAGAKYALVELDESPDPETEIARSMRYLKSL